MTAETLQLIILPAGLIAVLFAIYLARDVLARDTGTKAMQDVAGTIFEGAVAFIRRQYTTIAILAVVGAVVIGAVIAIVETPRGRRRPVDGRRRPIGITDRHRLPRRRRLLDGVRDHRHVRHRPANVRTAAAARRSLVEAVQVAMRGGAVSGFLVVALSLLGVYGIFTPSAVFGEVTVAQTRRSSSSASASAPRSSRCSPSSAAASTRRPPTSARTSSARSRRASPRTIRATRASSRTSSATTSATAPAAAPTCSSRRPPRTSAR